MVATNPFRKSNPTPNPSTPPSEPPASTIPTIQVSPSPPLPQLPSLGPPSSPQRQRFQPPPGPPPNQTSPSPQSTGGGTGQLEADDLNAEAPPAYTPSVDVHQGESVLEVGPRRPFQRVQQQPLPPAPPSQSQPQPQQHYAPPPSMGPEGIPDNGRPTSVPTSGHPLLLNNKMLVYPSGYECNKCL